MLSTILTTCFALVFLDLRRSENEDLHAPSSLLSFGELEITTRNSSCVNHLHDSACVTAGVDRAARTVDNLVFGAKRWLQSRAFRQGLSTKTMTIDLWERGCERLAAELPEQQFNTWIRPLPPADVSEEGEGYLVGLRVPNRFKLDWIRAQYSSRIETALTELAGRPVRLSLSLLPREALAGAANPSTLSGTSASSTTSQPP